MNYFTGFSDPYKTETTVSSNSSYDTGPTISDISYEKLRELLRNSVETASGCAEELPEIIDCTPVPDFPIPRKVLLPRQSGFKKEKFHSRKLRNNKIIYVKRKRNYRNITKEML